MVILRLNSLKVCIFSDLEWKGNLVSHSKSPKLQFRRRLQLVYNGSIVLSFGIMTYSNCIQENLHYRLKISN